MPFDAGVDAFVDELTEDLTALVSARVSKLKSSVVRLAVTHRLAELGLPAVGATVRAARADAIRSLRYRLRPEPMTLEAIGELIGVSPQRVHQLENPTISEALGK